MNNRDFSPNSTSAQRKQAAKAVPIVKVAALVPLTLKKKGAYYTFAEHDSVVIDPKRNCFWHNSQHVQGDTIAFLQHFCGYGYKEAVSAVLELVGENTVGVELPCLFDGENRDEKKFVMPDIAVDKDGKVYTDDIEKYLVETRCISPNIVRYFIDNGRLFQQSSRMKKFTRGRFRGCCLFVGYPNGTTNNTPNFCERRTVRPEKGKKKTLTVEGSDKKHGFYVNHFSPTLLVTEGILDFMAVMTIIEKNGANFCGYDYLALTGTGKTKAIATVLQEQPHIKRIILSLDNDEGGENATAEAIKMLKTQFPEIPYIVKKPKDAKDYNDLLIQQMKNRIPTEKSA